MLRMRVHPADLEESIKSLNENGYTVTKSENINARVVELIAEKNYFNQSGQLNQK